MATVSAAVLCNAVFLYTICTFWLYTTQRYNRSLYHYLNALSCARLAKWAELECYGFISKTYTTFCPALSSRALLVAHSNLGAAAQNKSTLSTSSDCKWKASSTHRCAVVSKAVHIFSAANTLCFVSLLLIAFPWTVIMVLSSNDMQGKTPEC